MQHACRQRQEMIACNNHKLRITNFMCSAREKTINWRLKLTLVRLQFDGFGRRYEDFVHHVRSSINDFCERIRAITNPSFMVGHLNWRRRKKKKMMNNPGFYKCSRITIAVYFMYFESIIVYRSTRRACSLFEKAFNISTFRSCMSP